MKQEYITIHRAIHDPAKKYVTVGVVRYPIEVSERNHCRYVDWVDPVTGQNIQFMEQNKRTKSRFAKSAKEGARITWGIPMTNGNRSGKWIMVTDNSRVTRD